MPKSKHIARSSCVQAKQDQILFDFEAFDLKRCCRCGQSKPIAQFRRDGQYPDGRRGYCKPCDAKGSDARRDRDELLAVDMKRCPKCGIAKPLDGFARNKRLAAGRDCYCKDCMAEAQRRRYPEWREKFAAIAQAWAVANRERINAAGRRRRAANRDKYVVYLREWRSRNRQRCLDDSLRFRERHRLELALRERLRYAQKRATAIGVITPESIAAKFAYWGNRCWMCGGPPTAMDHVKPLSKGGAHILANLRPACKSCNSRKSNAWPFSLAYVWWTSPAGSEVAR